MGELDQGFRSRFEDAIEKRSFSAVRKLRDKWPELLEVACECACRRPELQGQLLQLLAGDECWRIGVWAWTCLCSVETFTKRIRSRRNGAAPPWSDEDVKGQRRYVRERSEEWSRGMATLALRDGWDRFDPNRASLGAYLALRIDIAVDQLLRSVADDDSVGRPLGGGAGAEPQKEGIRPESKPILSLNQFRNDDDDGGVAWEPQPPDAEGPSERTFTKESAARIAALWAQVCLGPPDEWQWKGPPPHKGLPLWAMHQVLEDHRVQAFAAEYGNTRLAALAVRWVGECAHYWSYQWGEVSAGRSATSCLPTDVRQAFNVLSARLKQDVQDHIPPQGGGRKGLEDILETPVGDTCLGQYARGRDLADQLHHWLDDAKRQIRPKVREIAPDLYNDDEEG